MLIEIYCEKFLQKRISFTQGLNVILGGAKANNSIGKSTLLLIIDYCFGGDAYCKKQENDILKNIGNHTIYFTFKFGDNLYYYARNTSTPNIVFECDKEYKKINEKQLKEFNEFLNNYYFPNNHEMSFRTIIGRFMRVAGKENIHENKPLKGFNEDKDEEGINVLEELFGFYNGLIEIKTKLKMLSREKKARINAKKFNVVPNTINNKTEYKLFLDEHEILLKEKEELLRKGNIVSFDGDASFSDEAIGLKIQLENLLKKQSRLNYRSERLNKTFLNKDVVNDDELKEIKSFFPSINIKKLEDINNFHEEIIDIIGEEIKEEAKSINGELLDVSKEIKIIEEKLKNLNVPTRISPNIMKAITDKEAKIISNNIAIENYKKDLEIKQKIGLTKKDLANAEITIINDISNTINLKMESISDEINIKKRYAPYFTIINNNKYKFETPNDTGSGSKYKNLIVFDLSILKLSSLPVAIHDSIIFKNIGDDPINNVFKQYLMNDKQIFISIDKIEDYHNAETLDLLTSRAVIRLDDGSELFGKSWGDIGPKK